ncbi:DUF3060 domain-containing protein [Microbacterium hominis]|uniref:DUF3060 domain-containing protein n=1 Tax=Microbacterium hominis TaxID=162426 RepID=A0A0B4CPC0_9MICO|nr:DUF3060 domain-containing protein [Microbacterium hominis]KIC58277.1 hypothetical protein RM52_05995 [Microbacterium hominis]
MNTVRRPLALSFALLIAGCALAGCSVRVSDAGAATSTAADAAASTSPTAAAPSPSPSDSATVRGVVDDERMAKLQRSRWSDEVTQHVACVDGAYTVDRNADALVVEVTGDCREVTILASAATVLLPAVDELSVQGDGNIVIVAAAREIVLDAGADANLVGWESGTAVVKDAGTLNGTTSIS